MLIIPSESWATREKCKAIKYTSVFASLGRITLPNTGPVAGNTRRNRTLDLSTVSVGCEVRPIRRLLFANISEIILAFLMVKTIDEMGSKVLAEINGNMTFVIYLISL